MRAAIVGAGRMGRWHAAAARRAGADVLAVVDPDVKAAHRLASRCGAATRVFDDLARCLSSVAPDAVHVCTPLEVHGVQIASALEHGAHVLAEKPLAPSLAETKALLDAAHGAGRLVVPVHQFPFQPGVRRVLAERGRLGELVRVAYRTSTAGGAGRDAAGRRELLAEIAPHVASLFLAFAPGTDVDALDVTATGEDVAVHGLAGATHLHAFVTARGRPPRNELEVVGTRSSAYADLFHGFAVVDRGSDSGRGKAARPLRLAAASGLAALVNGSKRAATLELAYPGLRELVAGFYAAVRGEGPPPVGEHELLAAARLADRVRRG
ncbi:MAG TPA: Gfo/Idh/MocA family oxidoreductase [Gaiellaceae bacterium]|nr:Gfo/Idh/MocA family oxidoreductase [Gaiellaceae bacterium]